MGFAARDIFMLKVFAVAGLILLGAYLGLVIWLSQSGFMSEAEHFAAAAAIDNQTPHELTIEWLADGQE